MSRNELRPPGWPVRILRFLLKREYVEEIEGDMEEIFFATARQRSPAAARRNYYWEMLRLLRPILLRKFESSYNHSPFNMYRNYLMIAWRNLLKKKGYSAINILGLALGIACCLLIFMYVDYERSFDTYHTKGDRIYRVLHGSREETTDSYWVWSNAPIGQALLDNFPEIDKVVQFSGRSDILLTRGDIAPEAGETPLQPSHQEEDVFFMDSTAFDVFSWKLIKGDPKTALVAPYSIVLTESAAKKYFGDEDPLGKTLKGSDSPGRANPGEYLVTGVMEDVPANSHFRFNMLLSMTTFRKSNPELWNAWGYADFYTYFLANEQFDLAKFEEKEPEFIKRMMKNPDSKYKIVIEPLKDMYLGTVAQRQPGETGNISNLYIFSIIGLFVLTIAIINFMNLSTARSMERWKEVGIRKSIGAERKSLVSQFMGESFVIVGFSMAVALVIVVIALPSMNSITGRTMTINHFITLQSAGWLIAATLLIGLIAGSYPAFVLSSFNPVAVLKGMGKTGKLGVALRRGLVVFQFSLSIALIAGTIVVYFQMNHILNKDLGFDKEQMLILDYNYDGKVNSIREALKTEMESIPSVVSSSYTRSVPGGYFPNAYTEIVTPDGEMKGDAQPVFQVGIDFINHYGLELVAGRSYSRDYPSDTIGGLVLNEAAARQYGYSNPADIVGKKYKQWGREGEVIGVLKNFNYISLHKSIEPLTLPFEPYACRYMTLKVKPSDVAQTIEQVREVWSRLAPHRPFLYSFLDDDFDRQYQKDVNFRKLFLTFSSLAILIACLGLFGLATYTAELRTKEIGIRKVLGANVNSIVALLSRDFIMLIAIAMLLATPVAWYSMSRWLEGFAYRIDMQFWIFLLAGFVAIIIAAVTIGFQALKAARGNPVNSLRSE
jgi:putative ABC transport system permease protein